MENLKQQFNKYTIFVIIAIMVLSGIFGFIYETIFYKIDLGYFVKRGTTIGPWIPIYAFGGLFITLATFKLKEKPILVFLISCLLCGLLEFVTGYLLYHISNIRLWDYNTEILNFGNIGGYICFRSVAFFGVSGLLLVYEIIPWVKFVALKMNRKIFSIITLTPGILFLIDMVYSNIVK